jgi:tripartite-type tricarboxylate transporter receptor subunit TctC
MNIAKVALHAGPRFPAAAVPLLAAEYPNRPIKVVVPFGSGGVSDTTARITARAIEKALGQPVVVENKPGGDGRWPR